MSIKKSKPNQNLPHPQTGLTLIELVIVIAIIIVLFLISWMAWRNQMAKAHDAQRKDDLQRLSIAIENYYNDNECYPPAGIIDNCGGPELQPYLQSIPCDPLTNTPYCYIPGGENPAGCFQNYRLLSSLDYTGDPIIAKLLCHGDEFCGYEPICATAEQSGYNYGVSSLNIPVLNPTVSPPPPGGSPDPPPTGDYACDPAGFCNSYADPEGAGCRRIFIDPDECAAFCPTSDPSDRCNY